MRAILIWVMGMLTAGSLQAQSWQEPARGTPTRAALMDAIRPHVEWQLGAPVQFVVYDMRLAGDLAFASVYPQRPGGAEIDLRTTPGFYRGTLEPSYLDGLAVQVLYRKSGQTWVAVHWAMGATDVWYAYPELCAIYRRIVPEACQGQ